jgi:hypothetical protein
MILRKKCSNCDLYGTCDPSEHPGRNCKRMRRSDYWRPKETEE